MSRSAEVTRKAPRKRLLGQPNGLVEFFADARALGLIQRRGDLAKIVRRRPRRVLPVDREQIAQVRSVIFRIEQASQPSPRLIDQFAVMKVELFDDLGEFGPVGRHLDVEVDQVVAAKQPNSRFGGRKRVTTPIIDRLRLHRGGRPKRGMPGIEKFLAHADRIGVSLKRVRGLSPVVGTQGFANAGPADSQANRRGFILKLVRVRRRAQRRTFAGSIWNSTLIGFLPWTKVIRESGDPGTGRDPRGNEISPRGGNGRRDEAPARQVTQKSSPPRTQPRGDAWVQETISIRLNSDRSTGHHRGRSPRANTAGDRPRNARGRGMLDGERLTPAAADPARSGPRAAEALRRSSRRSGHRKPPRRRARRLSARAAARPPPAAGSRPAAARPP